MRIDKTPTDVLIETMERVDSVDAVMIIIQDDTGVHMVCNSEITLEQMSYMSDAAKHQIYTLAFSRKED